MVNDVKRLAHTKSNWLDVNSVKRCQKSCQIQMRPNHYRSLTDAVHKVLYLIDTINGKDQILQNYNARSIYRHWEVEVKDETLYFEADERIVIITYAKFGTLLEKYPDFHEHFEYIICDELHSLFKFERYSAQPNAHSIAHHGIERAVRNGHTKVIALSATPERIKREFDAHHYDVPIDDSNLIQYESSQITKIVIDRSVTHLTLIVAAILREVILKARGADGVFPS